MEVHVSLEVLSVLRCQTILWDIVTLLPLGVCWRPTKMKGLDKNMPIELVKQGFSQAIERLLLGLLKTELSTQLLRDVPQRCFFL